MSKLIFYLLVLFLTVKSFAQENIYDILGMDMVDTSDYEGKLMFFEEMPFNLLNKTEVDKKIDTEIEHAKNMHFKTLGDLNAFLAKNKLTDYEKVRAFFVWIEHHIEFDMHSYLSNHAPPQNAMVVYMGKRALSKGYADLFTLFCQNNEIECRTLKGYTKGFDPEKEHKDYPNHFWNAVRIDKYWYLLDIPMCIGKIENKKFSVLFNEDYFLSPPIEFIKSHLPIHSSWQLLETHIDLNGFYSQK